MRALLPAGLCCLVAAGCMSSGTSDPRLTKAEYVKQADAICAEFDGELAALPQPKDIDELAAMAKKAKPIAETGVAKLRALRPPEEIEERVNAWLERNDANVEAIQNLQKAAADGDETAVQTIAGDARDNERQADLMAGALGLRACANVSE